ncbi:MAG TPA: hypothetical protein VJI15_00445, partial [Candidatus Nanoarchaeia archaeon]|nr:hypothetical protein [Candidatus Nanoarchaeia archaeon]
MQDQEYQELMQKYKDKIKKEFGEDVSKAPAVVSSKEYNEFKRELYPARYTMYEKACNFSDQLLKMKIDPKRAEKL